MLPILTDFDFDQFMEPIFANFEPEVGSVDLTNFDS